MSYIKSQLKNILKPFAALYYSMAKAKYEMPELKEGVSAVIVARNESYSILMSLESLTGFADQVICIDNGSTDDTLQKMRAFQKTFSDRMQIEVLEAPGKLLGECRNMGLHRSVYSWHLRWDADMVFRQQTGKYNASWLKKKIMKIKSPAAVKLSRINLSGDLHHVSRVHDAVSQGEFFLVKRTRNLSYKEFKKFDVLALPLFYREMKIEEPIIFHLAQLKSLERIMYRNAYFNWRKSEIEGGKLKKKKEDFDSFKKKWELKMFGTNEPNAMKYRFQKKFVLLNSLAYDINKYGPYPEQIQQAIDKGNERFHFVYEDGKAVARKDEEDISFNNYIPAKDDLDWDVIAHLKNILSPVKLKKIGIDK